MNTEWHIEQNADRLLLRLSVGSAVLDTFTRADLLLRCHRTRATADYERPN
jgi:hypothetical protein